MQLSSEERVTSIDPVFGRMGIEAGHHIWSISELTMREKAILVIVADVCMPHLDLPFELHLKTGLTNAGMSVEDYRELLRHIAPEAGYSRTSTAFVRLLEVADALGFDTKSSPDVATERAAGPPVFPEHAREELRKLDPPFAAYAEDQAMQLWNRPGLSRRERCVASLGVDIISQALGGPFRMHIDMAEAAGMEREQIRAILRFMAEFTLPKAWEAFQALVSYFNESDERTGIRQSDGSGRASANGESRRSSDRLAQDRANVADNEHVTSESSVEILNVERSVISPADENGRAVVETRMTERFSGGLDGLGEAAHVRVQNPDGTDNVVYIERFTGKVDERSGSFILKGEAFTDSAGIVHGSYEIIEGSGTDELAQLRGFGAFMAKHNQSAKAGWSAHGPLTYWFERSAPSNASP